MRERKRERERQRDRETERQWYSTVYREIEIQQAFAGIITWTDRVGSDRIISHEKHVRKAIAIKINLSFLFR